MKISELLNEQKVDLQANKWYVYSKKNDTFFGPFEDIEKATAYFKQYLKEFDPDGSKSIIASGKDMMGVYGFDKKGNLTEAVTGNEGRGYHGEHPSKNADKMFAAMHAKVKKLVKGDDKVVTHYLDSTYGRHLADSEKNGEADDAYITKDFAKFKKKYNPELFEATKRKSKFDKAAETVGMDVEDLRDHLSDYRSNVRFHAGSHVNDPSAYRDFSADLKKRKVENADKIMKAIEILYFGDMFKE